MKTVAVVGAGAAGLAAAHAAAQAGARVTMHERHDRVGGTTALSGGVAWLPANDLADDTVEDALAYMRSLALGDVEPEHVEAFVRRRRADRGAARAGDAAALGGAAVSRLPRRASRRPCGRRPLARAGRLRRARRRPRARARRPEPLGDDHLRRAVGRHGGARGARAPQGGGDVHRRPGADRGAARGLPRRRGRVAHGRADHVPSGRRRRRPHERRLRARRGARQGASSAGRWSRRPASRRTRATGCGSRWPPGRRSGR